MTDWRNGSRRSGSSDRGPGGLGVGGGRTEGENDRSSNFHGSGRVCSRCGKKDSRTSCSKEKKKSVFDFMTSWALVDFLFENNNLCNDVPSERHCLSASASAEERCANPNCTCATRMTSWPPGPTVNCWKGCSSSVEECNMLKSMLADQSSHCGYLPPASGFQMHCGSGASGSCCQPQPDWNRYQSRPTSPGPNDRTWAPRTNNPLPLLKSKPCDSHIFPPAPQEVVPTYSPNNGFNMDHLICLEKLEKIRDLCKSLPGPSAFPKRCIPETETCPLAKRATPLNPPVCQTPTPAQEPPCPQKKMTVAVTAPRKSQPKTPCATSTIQGLLKPYEQDCPKAIETSGCPPMQGEWDTGILPILVQPRPQNARLSSPPQIQETQTEPSKLCPSFSTQTERPRYVSSTLSTYQCPQRRPEKATSVSIPQSTPSPPTERVSTYHYTPETPRRETRDSANLPETNNVPDDIPEKGQSISIPAVIENEPNCSEDEDIPPEEQPLGRTPSLRNFITHHLEPEPEPKRPTKSSDIKEVIINYVEEEIPYPEFTQQSNERLQSPYLPYNVDSDQNELQMRCVLTELPDSGEVKTSLEVNGRIIEVPKNMDRRKFFGQELQKMTHGRSDLRHTLDELKLMCNTVNNGVYQGCQDMPDLQETTRIKLKEEVSPTLRSPGTTMKDIQCVVQSGRKSQANSSAPLKTLQVNGQCINSSLTNTSTALEYIRQLQQIEETLETIADEILENLQPTPAN